MISELINIKNFIIINYFASHNYFMFFVLVLFAFLFSTLVSKILINSIKKFLEKKVKREEEYSSIKKFEKIYVILDLVFNKIFKKITFIIKIAILYLAFTYLNFPFVKYILEFFKILLILPFLLSFVDIFKIVFEKLMSKKVKKTNKILEGLIMKILHILIFIFGLLYFLNSLGFDIKTIVAGLGIGGLAFALAAQDILKNLFSGVSIILEGTIKKNDRIKVKGLDGWVEEVALRTTKIRTLDGSLVTIPNSFLSDNELENVSRTQKVKFSCEIGILYDYNLKKIKEAKKVLRKAVLKNKNTNKEDIYIWFSSYGEFSQNIYLICYGEIDYQNWQERMNYIDSINENIKEEFEKANIEMAFPTQTIEIKNKR